MLPGWHVDLSRWRSLSETDLMDRVARRAQVAEIAHVALLKEGLELELFRTITETHGGLL